MFTPAANTNVTSPMRNPAHSPGIKHVQMKMQDSTTGTRSSAGKWLPGMWPQQAAEAEAEQEQHHPIVENHLTLELASHDLLKAATQDNPPSNENPNFATLIDGDGAGVSSVEHLDTRRSKGDEFFQIPKIRPHKKLRNRKAHKLLLAPHLTLLPFTGQQLAEHLASLSVVEAGPSSKKKPTGDSGLSSTDSANGDESPRENGGGSYFDIAEAAGTGVTVTTPPVVDVVEVVEEKEEFQIHKYPYYSSISASSYNFCTPEIEDWGNLK